MSKSFAESRRLPCLPARRSSGRPDAAWGRGFVLSLAVASTLLLAPLWGCSQGPSSQLQQCRTQIDDLQQRLAEERQARKRTELEIRRLADRLAESEKELARNFDGTLAERPRLLRGDSDSAERIVPAPRQESSDAQSSAPASNRALPADGWRPIRGNSGD